MIDRLRFLLDRPLDPLAARAVVLFATAILVGFTAVFVLGVSESDRPAAPRQQAAPARAQPRQVLDRPPAGAAPAPPQVPPHRRRDPQDQKDSAAARRAARALRSHRAIQHVPYRNGELTVVLVGARGGRAALRVSAPTARAGRRGWHRYLRRYRDSGRAYIPIFDVGAGRNG
ncbi:MAG TPA: hypothetical protein VK471_11695 [Solirubrobacterales bacterium]|nr:hypothetical protein [Solirubrobacterales bacterium]